jgi:hypothetical protein
MPHCLILIEMTHTGRDMHATAAAHICMRSKRMFPTKEYFFYSRSTGEDSESKHEREL